MVLGRYLKNPPKRQKIIKKTIIAIIAFKLLINFFHFSNNFLKYFCGFYILLIYTLDPQLIFIQI